MPHLKPCRASADDAVLGCRTVVVGVGRSITFSPCHLARYTSGHQPNLNWQQRVQKVFHDGHGSLFASSGNPAGPPTVAGPYDVPSRRRMGPLTEPSGGCVGVGVLPPTLFRGTQRWQAQTSTGSTCNVRCRNGVARGVFYYPFHCFVMNMASARTKKHQLGQVPAHLIGWMERKCLDVRDKDDDDDLPASRTPCWYAEAAVVFLARHLAVAIPHRNRILWGIRPPAT